MPQHGSDVDERTINKHEAQTSVEVSRARKLELRGCTEQKAQNDRVEEV